MSEVRPRARPGRSLGETAPGQGRLTVARVDGASAVVACSASSPLHLFTPCPRGDAAAVLIATHGGGLVAGDTIDLELEVGPRAAAVVATQAETKVYRSEGAWAEQRVRARVGRGAALAVVPEPTSCFEAARYRQRQRFELDDGASLLLVDAVTPGRSARGERWAFDAYLSRNEVIGSGRLVLRDAVRLVRGEGAPIAARMHDLEILITLLALGPALQGFAAELRAEIGGLGAARAPVLAAASPLRDGVLLRLAARTVEEGLTFVRTRVARAEHLFGARRLARAC